MVELGHLDQVANQDRLDLLDQLDSLDLVVHLALAGSLVQEALKEVLGLVVSVERLDHLAQVDPKDHVEN